MRADLFILTERINLNIIRFSVDFLLKRCIIDASTGMCSIMIREEIS